MKRLSFALLASLILVASGTAYAQAPAAAPAAPIDPAALTAAKDMIESMKMRDVFVATMAQAAKSAPQMVSQMATASVNNNAKLTAAQKKEELAKIEKKIPEMTAAMQSLFADSKMVDEMVNEMAPLYARNFTAPEIREIAAFYKSAAGAKTLRVMPQLMNDSMQITQKVMMPRIASTMEKYTQLAAAK